MTTSARREGLVRSPASPDTRGATTALTVNAAKGGTAEADEGVGTTNRPSLRREHKARKKDLRRRRRELTQVRVRQGETSHEKEAKQRLEIF